MRKVYLPEGLKEDSEFWDDTWAECSIDDALKGVDQNFMDPIFLKYFPKSGKILEAGCGLGKFVIHYRKKGYDIEGIDFAGNTIDRLKKYDASLPVSTGDLTRLNCGDGHYKVYYSGGVIEHYEESPGPILDEAYRVLGKDGLLIVTVPCLNFIRRMEDHIWFRVFRQKYREKKSVRGIPNHYVITGDCRKDDTLLGGWVFYSYMFGRCEIIKLLRKSGFRRIFSRYVQVQWGIKTVKCFSKIGTSRDRKNETSFLVRAIKSLLREDRHSFVGALLMSVAGFFFAHQIVLVCRKVNGET